MVLYVIGCDYSIKIATQTKVSEQRFCNCAFTTRTYRHRTTTMPGFHDINQRQRLDAIQQHASHLVGFFTCQCMRIKIGMVQFNYRLRNTPRWGAIEGDHGMFIKP